MEAAVCKTHELLEGDLRQVQVGETAVLLARSADGFYALGAVCPHAGAPLAKGLLHGQRLVCPWHMASFNVQTGLQCEPPGLDSLSLYPLRIEGDDVVVEVPEPSSPHRPAPMAAYDPSVDGRTFAILGAGIAGQTAAEMLRQEGFQGRIIMITAEAENPYRRTALSKGYLQGDGAGTLPALRPESFFEQHHIEIWRDRTVTAVKPYEHSLTFDNGEELAYDQLLLATGGKARPFNGPGADLQNVFTLHRAEDAAHILAAAQIARRAVVVGASFIAMETAASLTQAGLAVTVVSPTAVPFETTFGAGVGRRLLALHQDNGVEFCLSRRVTALEGDGAVAAAVLDSGDRIETDLVIVGIGIDPATDFLAAMPLHSGDGSVLVDAYLNAVEGVYAAGDVARYPDSRSGRDVRIEHWRLAAQHGRVAACNMLGQRVPFRGVPFFWTKQFSINLHYVGHADRWDDTIVHGDLEAGDFLVFYVESDQILAVLANGFAAELLAISELMRLGEMPPASTLSTQPANWVAMLKQPVAAYAGN
ncbi:FAD-dependent oxidoreductase [Nodosilinea nodulosa]|uniref:FAD-dependent oxidoreductase n=1 Tax=Nodosilinea nodulosa TaxID=416001 RepID=UPI0002E9C403|nr:FAD-dependent oxidoreductase [Nodosilinea nodulosa]